MARLPSYRRIREQDYSAEDQGLIRTLSVSLNYGIEVLYELLNGKLSIRDNLASTIKEIDIEVNTQGIPKTKQVIKKSSSDRIEGLMVINYSNLTNSTTYATSGITINYTETTDSIIINHVTGIPADNLFRLKVWAVR